MAFDLEQMTIDYKKLLRLVPTQRNQLAQSGAINDIIGVLTPGQLVSLFPRYYRDQLPDVGQVNKYSAGLDVALSGAPTSQAKKSGGISTYGNAPSPGLKKTLTPEEKAIQEIFKEAKLNQFGSGATSGITDNKGRVISTASTNISPQERALLDTVAMWESPNYNTIVGGQSFEDFSDHPRVLVGSSTAAGRYQFTKDTWDETVAAYNRENPNNPITDFSPENQDKAALYLARQRYKANTGRDLDADLASPPKDFGALIKAGLGFAGGKSYLTWEAFVKKNADQIQNAFDSNYERNIGYVEEIEKAADTVKGLETVIQKFEPSMIGQLDERLQKWYENASEVQKKKFETALERLGTDQFNKVMEKQAINSATLQAAALSPQNETRFSVLGGNIDEVDPRLQSVIKAASNDLPEGYTVRAISGKDARATRTVNHPNGLAMDVQIYDKDGNLIPHNSNSPGWKHYEQLFRSVHIRGKDMYPDEEFIWGGAWISDAAGRGDPMHYQIVDRSVSGSSKSSGRYSFETGLDPSHPFVREGGQLTPEERSAYDEAVRNNILKEKEKATRIREEAEAITQGSPVSAARIKQEELQANSVPSYASGGDIPPGENIAGVNLDTGKLEFMANDRESIRIRPGELEGSKQYPMPTQEQVQQLETAIQKPDRLTYNTPSDPNMYIDMAEGSSLTPPSQIRATNRARLYGDDSNRMINGHFA